MPPTCTAAALVESAKCFPCVPRGTLRAMRIAALCQRAVFSCGTETDCIVISGAGRVEVNVIYTKESEGLWLSSDGFESITGPNPPDIFSDVPYYGVQDFGTSPFYIVPATEFPCGTWTSTSDPPYILPVPQGEYITCGDCPAPIAPDIVGTYDVNGNLQSVDVTSNTTGNVGGTFQLWGVVGGTTEMLEEVNITTTTFNRTVDWDDVTSVFVVEVGNGTDWCGSSTASQYLVANSFQIGGEQGGDYLAGEGAGEPIIGEIPSGIFISSMSLNTFTQCFTGAPIVAVFGNGFESGGYFAIPVLRAGVPDTIYYDGVRSPGTSQFIDSNTMLLNTFFYPALCPDAGTYDLQYYKPDNTLGATFTLAVILTP